MQIAIIGAGRVGTGLAHRFTELGHSIAFGVRNPERDGPRLAETFPAAGVLAPRDAAGRSDVVVLAVPWAAAREAVTSLGDLGGRILVDATNPVGSAVPDTDPAFPSGAEAIARWATGARVVKAFNTIGAQNYADLDFEGTRAMGLICGDDDDARHTVMELAASIGFDVVDLGPLANASLAEAAAKLWITLAYQRGLGPDFGIGLLRRKRTGPASG